MEIKLVITDFDGTLFDTRRANCKAYIQAFEEIGVVLTPQMYDRFWGLRLNDFLESMGIQDDNVCQHIRQRKKEIYPIYFDDIRLNDPLWHFLCACRSSGAQLAIASTAQRHNILHVLAHFGMEKQFDLIVSGEDIARGKPDSECYETVMKRLCFLPEQTLIFEDSEVGIEAAERSRANYFVVNNLFYGD